MKFKALAAQTALAALVTIGAAGAAFAQSDCKTLVQPSPFGADDQIGATNRITPAVTKAAASEIQSGVVIPLWNVLVDGVPLFGTRFEKTILTTSSLVPVISQVRTSSPLVKTTG